MSIPHDEVLYPTSPEARLHLENLYLRAYLNQYSPPPVETARVLEVGCGTGFNLMPQALEFPEARFVGFDYAKRAIDIGKSVAEQLGIKNLELRFENLLTLGDDLGEFDYIIAHGFYSWVPDEVRDALWRLVQKSLSPNGIFHLSYNALPGWYPVFAVRDLGRFLSSPGQPIASQADRLYDALGVFSKYADSYHPLALEAARIRKLPKEVLFHDQLSPECRPFYLSDVVSRAASAGLRYVAEASPYASDHMRAKEDIAKTILVLSGDNLALRQQLLDFVDMRRFHDSLFTHAAHVPERRSLSVAILPCWARSDVHFVANTESRAREYEHSGGIRLTSSHPALCTVLDALEQAYPGSISLAAMLESLQASSQAPPVDTAIQFSRMIAQLVEGGVIRLRLKHVPVATQVSEKPCAPPFTRIRALFDPSVPDVYHSSSSVPEGWQRALMWLLDGTRTHAELVEQLTEHCWNEIQAGSAEADRVVPFFQIAAGDAFAEDPSRVASRENLEAYLRERVPAALQAFCRGGFLV